MKLVGDGGAKTAVGVAAAVAVIATGGVVVNAVFVRISTICVNRTSAA